MFCIGFDFGFGCGCKSNCLMMHLALEICQCSHAGSLTADNLQHRCAGCVGAGRAGGNGHCRVRCRSLQLRCGADCGVCMWRHYGLSKSRWILNVEKYVSSAANTHTNTYIRTCTESYTFVILTAGAQKSTPRQAHISY